MKIVYSKHAFEQLKERNIEKKLVDQALIKPQQIIEGKKGRKIVQRKYMIKGKEFLMRVIFKENPEFVEVVTMYLTTRIKKYWSDEP